MAPAAEATPPRGRPDDGAAVVDFVFVSGLVVLLFLVVFEVGVALHTRNVLTSLAAEGARYGADADVRLDDPAVAQQVREGITSAFSPGYAARARISTSVSGGVDEVRITAPLPVALLFSGPLDLTVTGHALEEGR